MRGIQKIPVQNFEPNLLADRVLVGKVLTRESLIDDHHVASGSDVVLGKGPAAEQRHAERLKIVLTDRFMSGFPPFNVRPAGNNHVSPVGLQGWLLIALCGFACGESMREPERWIT